MMTASSPRQSFRVVACMILLASTFIASDVSADEDRAMHVGRVIGSTAVPMDRGQGASRAGGPLGLGDPCNCDEDCDAGLGDQCNIVQCIVRGVCSGDNTTPCSTSQGGGSPDADCEENEKGEPNGICQQNSFVQRCDVVQLIGWPCDANSDFCTMDQCEDDGTGSRTSVCTPQDDGAGGPLSACPKQCVGGPATSLRCTQSSDCPQGSCEIMPGGGCDSAAETCYVGASLATAIGRCCTNGACSETDEATCTSGGGAWDGRHGPSAAPTPPRPSRRRWRSWPGLRSDSMVAAMRQ
ncbi:MAG: hypothetical protein IH897_11730 [Planctomycetes bacterium]|nr:hypothetical protein [Planctomycetota bacterium]